MNWSHVSLVASAVVCLGAFLACAAGCSSIGRPRDRMECPPATGAGIWSMASVRELYKLSGWRVVDVRRIWANEDWPSGDPRDRHNAFTDLAWFKDYWYCVFRVGENHGVSSPPGGLRVIRSKDGKKWTSVFFYQPKEKTVDVRDPKLAVTQDGRIVMLGYEDYRFEPARSIFKDYPMGRSLTCLSSDGEHWSGPNFSKGGENTWIWGVAWHKGVGYGVAYSRKDAVGALYRTIDGKEWEPVAENIFPKDARGNRQGNEASIFFDADDSAWMFLREAPSVNGKLSNVGFARPPYKEWDWSRQTDVNLGGPKMIRMSDGRIVVAGRVWLAGDDYGDSHTALFELDVASKDQPLHKILDLPSQGDNAYPGIVEKDGELWISYYSAHEDPNPEGREAHLQRTCIYLARVKIGGPRYVYFRGNPIPSDQVPVPAKADEVLPPKLPVEQFREAFNVDLSAFVNRALADDVADNGAGGWSDQGPTCDMRNVKTGLRKFGGVPFNILAGKSAVVLASVNRKLGNLPDKVNIPFGRKADAIFFLHSIAYLEESSFKYVLHYADGKDVTITMNSRNIVDWIADPIARFPGEKGTFTTVAQTVPNQMFKQGSMYRTEWTAPADRRNVELRSIEFTHDGTCVPILVAITGVLSK